MERLGKICRSDEDLVRRTLAGDGEAFGMLAGRYAPVIASIAKSKLGSKADLDEVVQECFVSAYCRLQSLRDPGKFSSWVQGIALNLCRRHIESQDAFKRFCSRHPGIGLAPTPDETLLRSDQAEELAKSLDSLTALQRQAVALFYFHEDSVEQIAVWLGRPVGTVKRTLSDARAKLREELIEMARHEFADYHLSDALRKRLARIPSFPLTEPVIRIELTDRQAQAVAAEAPYGNFPSLLAGSEAVFADYDYPSRALKAVSHTAVRGPIQIAGENALRYDAASFTKDGKLEGFWRPHYRIDGSKALYCAKEFGECESALTPVLPDNPNWGESQPEWEDLVLAPGSSISPAGGRPGFEVDSCLWTVQIGRRSFECLRRLTGGDLVQCAWPEEPVGNTATEEFFLPDGRLLLWRRYNGPSWRSKKSGSYEALAKANTPILTSFGQKYLLWYDQIPDYALS